MDWGMARRISDASEELHDSVPPSSQDLSATMAGAVMGTPMYMAPEQALGQSDKVGPESDQFALGLILFALCTLRPARKAPSVAEMLQLAQIAPPITFKRGEVAPGLRAIIRKATTVTPEQRYKSVQKLADDVRRFVRGRRVKAHRETHTQRIRRVIQNYPSATLSVMLLALVIGLFSSAAGLYQAFETEKKARVRESKLVHRISTVNQTAQNAERYLLRLQSLQMAVAESVQLRLQQRRSYPVTAVHETKFGKIEDGKFVPLPTSVTAGAQMRTSWMVAEGGDVQQAQRELAFLGKIGLRFRQAMLHAIDPRLARSALNDEQVIRRLMQENSVKYLYIGLESGMLLNFPGITLPKGYDPRKRPWYRGSMLTQFTAWGSIYPDASGSGYLVPCNSVVRDLQGNIVGVVGLDISANQLLDLVNQLKLPQLSHLMLINRQGRVVLKSTDRGLRTIATNADNKARRGVPVEVKRLEIIAKEGRKTGALQIGEDTYVHAPLPALGLMLVAKLKL
ncbi:MAG TPA: hypothetical protein DCQ06_04130 [Myxococcales bacterium]|nr:hypothetical protein [Myxococcales bacterium]